QAAAQGDGVVVDHGSARRFGRGNRLFVQRFNRFVIHEAGVADGQLGIGRTVSARLIVGRGDQDRLVDSQGAVVQGHFVVRQLLVRVGDRGNDVVRAHRTGLRGGRTVTNRQVVAFDGAV